MRKYTSLRKKALGLAELHMYDIYPGIFPDIDWDIPFSQAREEVLEATKVLGTEYHEILKSSFEHRWMDIYENEGKRTGAFVSGCAIHPFVLLNYKDTLDSEFELAHEMGHAMHFYLTIENQPLVYAAPPAFVAEVASLCNESLLMQHLLKKATNKKERAVLINHFCEQFRAAVYRQTMLAEFELIIHQMAERGETLTAQRLCEIYYNLNKFYYGDISIDREIEMEWARIPHLYMHFYVYQYATGFSAAIAISKRILTGGEKAVQDYLRFLRAGSSTDPLSLPKIAGVDMSTPQPINDALELFGELIDELEGLLQ